MYNSKFKLVLGWSLFIIFSYIFWLFAYFVLAKFALSEISSFRYGNIGLSEALSLGNIFWYLIYIGGIVLCIYVIRLFIIKSPAPKSAALIYAALIVISEAVLVKGLADSTPMINIFPHIAINTCFLFGIIFTYFKHGAAALKTQAD